LGSIQKIYPNERKIKDTTDTKKSASYFDFHIEIDNGSKDMGSFSIFILEKPLKEVCLINM
jgi:hypothetical protein